MSGENERYGEFLKVLKGFDHAMLVTRRGDALRSRPMAVAGAGDDGKLWFLTRDDSAKHEELVRDPGVNVAMQGNGRFLSVTGSARVLRDPEQAARLWQESQRAWFPGGPRDPRLVLIEVVPSFAEYWDRSGAEALRYRFAEARAISTHRRLDEDDAGAHGKVPF